MKTLASVPIPDSDYTITLARQECGQTVYNLSYENGVRQVFSVEQAVGMAIPNISTEDYLVLSSKILASLYRRLLRGRGQS